MSSQANQKLASQEEEKENEQQQRQQPSRPAIRGLCEREDSLLTNKSLQQTPLLRLSQFILQSPQQDDQQLRHHQLTQRWSTQLLANNALPQSIPVHPSLQTLQVPHHECSSQMAGSSQPPLLHSPSRGQQQTRLQSHLHPDPLRQRSLQQPESQPQLQPLSRSQPHPPLQLQPQSLAQPAERAPNLQPSPRLAILSLALDVQDVKKRDYALRRLHAYKRTCTVLAPILWNSCGFVPALVGEIVAAQRMLSPPSLTLGASARACHAMSLLQAVASHPETRAPLLRSQVPLFAFPFLNTSVVAMPYEQLRVAGLGLVGGLLKEPDSTVVSCLLCTDILPLCLRMVQGYSELCNHGSLHDDATTDGNGDNSCHDGANTWRNSTVLATFIIQQILVDDAGLAYVCHSVERVDAVAMVLRALVEKLLCETCARMLKMAVRCFLRLSSVFTMRPIVTRCLPDALREFNENRQSQRADVDLNEQADSEASNHADTRVLEQDSPQPGGARTSRPSSFHWSRENCHSQLKVDDVTTRRWLAVLLENLELRPAPSRPESPRLLQRLEPKQTHMASLAHAHSDTHSHTHITNGHEATCLQEGEPSGENMHSCDGRATSSLNSHNAETKSGSTTKCERSVSSRAHSTSIARQVTSAGHSRTRTRWVPAADILGFN